MDWIFILKKKWPFISIVELFFFCFKIIFVWIKIIVSAFFWSVLMWCLFILLLSIYLYLSVANVTIINSLWTRRWWLPPVILATQVAEIRRIAVQSQTGQIVHETLSREKKKSQKKGWWNVSRYRPWVQTPVPQK
jgi:hypothetical protein